MIKKLFTFNTNVLVGSALGAALFALLQMYAVIPTGLPGAAFRTAYGMGGSLSAILGPIAGFFMALIGHFISDTMGYGAWWHQIIASAVCCLIIGLVHPRLQVKKGLFTVRDVLAYNLAQIIANGIAWFLVAPLLGMLFYSKSAGAAFSQALAVGLSNMVTTGIIGTALLYLYSLRRKKKAISAEK